MCVRCEGARTSTLLVSCLPLTPSNLVYTEILIERANRKWADRLKRSVSTRTSLDSAPFFRFRSIYTCRLYERIFRRKSFLAMPSRPSYFTRYGLLIDLKLRRVRFFFVSLFFPSFSFLIFLFLSCFVFFILLILEYDTNGILSICHFKTFLKRFLLVYVYVYLFIFHTIYIGVSVIFERDADIILYKYFIQN